MGRPWIGNAQIHPFSPLLLPFLLHPSPWTYGLQFLLGSLACLLGAFFFFREIEIDPLLAAAGAALWTWNPFTSAIYIMSSAWAYWWMPAALAGALYAVKRRKMIGWTASGAAFALMLLCGHPETTLVLGEMWAILVGTMIIAHTPRAVSVKWVLGGLALAGFLAAVLSAAQWVPVLQVVKDAAWYKSQAIGSAQDLTHAASQLVRPASGVFLIPVVLAAAVLAFGRKVRWEVLGFSLVFLFCLGFSVPTVFRSLPYRLLRLDGVVPPLHGIELICIPAVALAVLGLEALMREGGALRLNTAKGVAAVLAVALTLWAVHAPAAGRSGHWVAAAWLIACVLAFVCVLFLPSGRARTGTLACVLLFAALYPLAAQRFKYPYFSGSPQPDYGNFLPAGSGPPFPPPRFWAQSSPRTRAPFLIPNLCLLSDRADIRSSSVFNPKGTDVFSHAWGPGGYFSYFTYTFANAKPNLLSFLGVARAVVANPPPGSLFKVYPLRPGPRAFLVHDVIVKDSDTAAIAEFKDLLRRGGLYKQAVVAGTENAAGIPSNVPRNGSTAKGGPSRITWLGYGPSRLRLRVHATAPGLLVVTDTFTHLWRARVDGAPAPLLKADVMFRGVPVPGGSHTVDMGYDTRGMAWSMRISLFAWILLAAFSVYLVRRNRALGRRPAP